MSAVIMTLAHLAAKKVVQANMRAKGTRLADVDAREIKAAARDYLRDHPELIPQTIERVQSSPALRALFEKEQRQREREAKRQARASLERFAQNAKA